MFKKIYATLGSFNLFLLGVLILAIALMVIGTYADSAAGKKAITARNHDFEQTFGVKLPDAGATEEQKQVAQDAVDHELDHFKVEAQADFRDYEDELTGRGMAHDPSLDERKHYAEVFYILYTDAKHDYQRRLEIAEACGYHHTQL